MPTEIPFQRVQIRSSSQQQTKTLVPIPQSPHHIPARSNSSDAHRGVAASAMEAAAVAMRAPKRRRSVGTGGQQVPQGRGSGLVVEQGSLDDLDLISGLPDEVLGTVVSFLPTRDGARTQVLSRRWLPLWRSRMAPLNLVVDLDLCDEQSRAAVVSKILSDHPGPARRFSVLIASRRGSRAKVVPWFRSERLAGLHELEVANLHKKGYPLPRGVMARFAPTLRLLKLSSCCRFRVKAPLSFPHLKHLILHNVGVSDDSLRCLISGCAVLQSISLSSMRFGCLCISSPTLRSINLHSPRSKGSELVIEDAPCLERLLLDFPKDGLATIQVIRAPKLQILDSNLNLRT